MHRFKAVVWNNVSGDVLTPEQREAFKSWLEDGGGFVALHAAGDNSHHEWAWYQDVVLKAHFTGHPLAPQFQEAVMNIEDTDHPATHGLERRWVRTEEWYSFETSPRGQGVRVLATVDESTYRPVITLPFPISLFKSQVDLHMGKDHPVIWSHCQGRGRVLYSALGHQASAYAEPVYQRLLDGALSWAMGTVGTRCVDGQEVADAAAAMQQP